MAGEAGGAAAGSCADEVGADETRMMAAAAVAVSTEAADAMDMGCTGQMVGKQSGDCIGVSSTQYECIIYTVSILSRNFFPERYGRPEKTDATARTRAADEDPHADRATTRELTHDDVMQASIQIDDDDGLAALTMHAMLIATPSVGNPRTMEASFDFCLQRVLDGIEHYVNASRKPPERTRAATGAPDQRPVAGARAAKR